MNLKNGWKHLDFEMESSIKKLQTPKDIACIKLTQT